MEWRHPSLLISNRKIEKVNKLLQGLLKNASYLLFSPEDCGITNREMMYFYPLGQQARYVADPDFGEDMIELFNKNKSSQLNEWHRTLFIKVIKEISCEKNKNGTQSMQLLKTQ